MWEKTYFCVWNQFPNLWLAKPHPDVIVWLWILDILFAGMTDAKMHPFWWSAKGKKQLCTTAECKSQNRKHLFNKIHQVPSVL